MPRKKKVPEVESLSLVDPPVDPIPKPISSVMKKNAMKWYTDSNDLRLEHSAPPQYNFTKRSSGERVTVSLGDMVAEYKQAKKEEARQKRLNSASEPPVPRLW